jgi:hypothetical protein
MFVRTRLGARMPLDPKPYEDGTVELIDDDDGEVYAEVTGNATLFHQDVVRYRAHWATCKGDVKKVRNR